MATARRYDAVVVGAGPAGCAAALTLHQAGQRVCLVDDASPNSTSRPKVGESLPGAVRRLLPQLGIAGLETLLAPADYHPCVGNVSAWGSEHWTYQDALRNPDGGGWHLNRAAFDAALRRHTQAAGVPLYLARLTQLAAQPAAGGHPGHHLLGLRATGEPLLREIQTPWLIDATGRAAFVSRRLQGGRHKLDNQLAAVAWVAAPLPDQDSTTRVKSVPGGWWYTARLPTGQRVICFHGLPALIAALVRDPAAFLTHFNAAGLLPHLVAPTVLPTVSALDASVAHARQAAMPGLLCVGDAALAFDPLAAQGLFFALYSGWRAGEALVQCWAPTQQAAALADYQAQVSRVFTASQRARHYFYTSETRYAQDPYWRSRLGSTRC